MRILFWSETFWPRVGGVENLAAKLLPALRERGHEFAVVTWENIRNADQIRYQDIPVYRYPFFSGGDRTDLAPLLENRRRVAQLKREFAPELVHINSYGGSTLFHVNTASSHPAPVLVTLHQALPNESIERDSLLGHLLRSATWITACSASVLDHARQLLPEIVPSSSVIHNGIEMPALDPPPIACDPPRILCVGRLVPEKGFDLALAAFEIVLRRFPSARLVFAGEGPELEKLRHQALDSQILHSVEFVGGVPPERVAGLMGEATLVLVPSRLEGFGLVALEAGSMARPVVATQVGGLPELIVHEETGLLTAYDNSQALASAIDLLLEQPEKARRMGWAARERARNEFAWKRHVDAYDALYRKLTVDSGGREALHTRRPELTPR